MNLENWEKELNLAVTISDENGDIVKMNDKSILTNMKYGGASLIGTSLYDCHPEPANEIIKRLYRNKETNAYTIEKEGVKKLIYQTPWYEEGVFKGLVELSIVLPENMPHFIRK